MAVTTFGNLSALSSGGTGGGLSGLGGVGSDMGLLGVNLQQRRRSSAAVAVPGVRERSSSVRRDSARMIFLPLGNFGLLLANKSPRGVLEMLWKRRAGHA